MRFALACLILFGCVSQLAAQEPAADPFGAPGHSDDSDWAPVHPDGDTPLEKMNSLVHTDALPRCDRVEILAIFRPQNPFDESAKQEIPKEKAFPLRPYGSSALILASRIVGDTDAEKVCKAWRALEFDRLGGAFCHVPAYGLRFYRGDDLLFETSVCWKCRNFYLPTLERKNGKTVYQWYGFSGNQDAKDLLDLMKSLLKHPKL